MNPFDPTVDIAARIADGSAIDWAALESEASDPDTRARLAELRAIAELATLHRSHAAAVDASQSAAPAAWGPLTIVAPVGAGQFGEVFLAWDARLHRRVALKRLYGTIPALASPSRAIHEARLLARVRHPNVLTVYGAECIDDRVGIWTEFIEGRTLEAVLAERGPLPAEEVLDIGVHLASALSAVHEAGLLHHDVKAHNVMREVGGRIVLMDFGAGLDLDTIAARAGDLSGTPLYLAPELFEGAPPSVATDVYALAVLLFRLLSGQYPVSGQTLDEVRAAHASGAAASLAELRPDASSALVDATARGLARDSAERFGSASEFELALRAAQSGHRHDSDTQRDRLRRFGVVVTVLAALAVTVSVVLWRRPQPRRETAPPTIGQMPAVERSTATPSPPLGSVTPYHLVSPAGARFDAPRDVLEAVESRLVLPNVAIADPFGSISANGRWLVQSHGRALEIRDLQRPDYLNVVDVTPAEGEGSPSIPVFSRDAKSVAYRWAPAAGGRPRLGVVDLPRVDGSRPQLFVDDPEVGVALVHDWSADGSAVLVTLTGPGPAAHLAWVTTRDGVIRRVKELTGPPFSMVGRARVSPDGRQIAYAGPTQANTTQALAIHLMAADGSRDEPITTNGGSHPVWSPRGTELLYSSAVSGTVDLLSMPIVKGRPAGAPTVVQANIGSGWSLGLAADGTYYFRTNRLAVDTIFILPVGAGTATLAPIEALKEFTGSKPQWRPDSTAIAFLRRNPGSQLKLETVESVLGWIQTGTEQVLDRNLPPYKPMFWLGWLDRTRVLEQVSGLGAQGREWRRVAVDLANSRPTKIGESLQSDDNLLPATALSPDGKTLYTFAHDEPNASIDSLVAIDIASGTTSRVFELSGNLRSIRTQESMEVIMGFGLAVSPDGHDLAVAVRVPEDKTARLFRVGVDGQGFQQLYRPYLTQGTAGKVAWTTHGIYFSELVASPRSPAEFQWRVMRISPGGGAPKPLLEINGSDYRAQFDPSPDGSMIAVHPDPTAAQSFSRSTGLGNALWAFRLVARQPREHR
jgi:serine/threonine protein kinase/Tol biopolymer transport system component